MQWTHSVERNSLARTSDDCADGEVVWFWRSDAGAKVAESSAGMTVATKHGHREEHEGNRTLLSQKLSATRALPRDSAVWVLAFREDDKRQ